VRARDRVAHTHADTHADTRSGHHAGDVGPPPAWGGIGDDIYGPCASAGMFGCAPVNSTNDYTRDGDPHVRAAPALSVPPACTAALRGRRSLHGARGSLV